VTTWIRVATVGAIEPGAVMAIDLAGVPAALCRDGDAYFATQRKCPHAGFDLCEGFVSRGNLVCPLHLWRFEVATGSFVDWPETGLTTYAVRVVGDAIEVDPTPRRRRSPDPFAGDDP
jgi:nitrite reductase/ring-hydroxylating ferredoxin subunit